MKDFIYIYLNVFNIYFYTIKIFIIHFIKNFALNLTLNVFIKIYSIRIYQDIIFIHFIYKRFFIELFNFFLILIVLIFDFYYNICQYNIFLTLFCPNKVIMSINTTIIHFISFE